MLYDIAWVKGLSDSDLILCNLLTFMRIYHYNLRYYEVEKSILLVSAEAYGITKVTVLLRTRDNKTFTPSPYYVSDDEAEVFKEKIIAYYDEARKEG